VDERVLVKRRRIARAMLRNPRMVPSGIEKHLKVMREDGAIRRVGPARGGHWEVLP
jgi:hypothetical protein